MDTAQYEWMLSELLDLYQNYPSEDEIMMQYLLPALCKALAVLKMVSGNFVSGLITDNRTDALLTCEIIRPSLVWRFHVREFLPLISSVLQGFFSRYSGFSPSLKSPYIGHSRA